ncbi:hypothetical protein CDD82_3701 [Ophiocordyceps australis]|uniref:Uncharacterized protein n=1 Tax=Ophiocordyceps australis TaxID=1399860 RepID=A0A2C5Z593_9HYPO|nr:hypothetical protein CDD82_3701 [Ophiocordyceps australis]
MSEFRSVETLPETKMDSTERSTQEPTHDSGDLPRHSASDEYALVSRPELESERSPSPQSLMRISHSLGVESTAHTQDAAPDAKPIADSLGSNVEKLSPRDLDISSQPVAERIEDTPIVSNLAAKFEPSWRPDIGSNQSTSWDAPGAKPVDKEALTVLARPVPSVEPLFEKLRGETELSEKAPLIKDDNVEDRGTIGSIEKADAKEPDMTTRPDSILGLKPTADAERSASPELDTAQRNLTSPSPGSEAYKGAPEKSSVTEPEPTSTLQGADQVKAQFAGGMNNESQL